MAKEEKKIDINNLPGKAAFLKNNKINLDYRVEGNTIIIGKKKYTLFMLFLVYSIICFTSVMLIILGVMRVFRHDYKAILSILFGVITFAIGMLYRYIYKKAKTKIKETQIQN